MQARAIKLMASKLAAATLVEGNFSDEGLAAMSDCADMTSQLARELTKGIRDEVEDVAEIFKKMAIIKDENEPEEDMSAYVITDSEQTPAENIRPETLSVSEKLKKAMLLAKQAKGIRDIGKVQKIKYTYDAGEQITLFDLAS